MQDVRKGGAKPKVVVPMPIPGATDGSVRCL